MKPRTKTRNGVPIIDAQAASDKQLDAHERFVKILTKHRQSLAFFCDCGDDGCPGKFVPSPSDPRVVALTLASVRADADHRDDTTLQSIADEYAREYLSQALPVAPAHKVNGHQFRGEENARPQS